MKWRMNEAVGRVKVTSVEMFVITQTDTDADYYLGLSSVRVWWPLAVFGPLIVRDFDKMPKLWVCLWLNESSHTEQPGLLDGRTGYD